MTASRQTATATATQLTYTQAVERLLWLGHEGRSLKWDLNNIRAVLERLGHPERQFAAVHIAGTNGKGSVAALVDSILRQANYRTGLYTSPHLVRINERLAVEGVPAGDAEFAAAFNAVAHAIEALLAEGRLPHQPSYFETLTAMALWHFVQAQVQVAVLEVGLGGRLDATNAVTPAVCAITSIDFDHERYLGHAIEQIAAEKAGIVKPDVPVVNAAEHPAAHAVIARRAAEVGAPLIDLASDHHAEQITSRDFGCYQFTLKTPEHADLRLSLSLRGRFQIPNALTAVAIARELARQGWNIPSQAIQAGIAQARWPGRLQLVRPTGQAKGPLLFLDGAHNPAGARRLAEFWDEHLAPPQAGLGGRRLHLIYGTLRDKAVDEIAEWLFPRAASLTLTQPATPRAAGVDTLAPLAHALNPQVAVEPDPAQALARALAHAAPEDAIFVAGSLFLVGDCLKALAAGTTVSAARK